MEKIKILPEVKEEYMRFEDIIYYEKKETEEAVRKEEQEKAEKAINERGRQQKVQDILELLEEYGTIPESILKRLESEQDSDMLRKWHKLAARVGDLDTFESQM